MHTIKKLLGIAPRPVAERPNAFEPSALACQLGVPDQTNYDHHEYPNAYTAGDHRILMICTEQGYLTTRNGKEFATGNHPVEMLVPMLHFRQAGFQVDVVTPTGQPVQIEQWAMPADDQAVQAIYADYREQFAAPLDLREVADRLATDAERYEALFFPGGHGALLGLPDNEDVKKAIQWAVRNDKFVLAICHGPAALLAARRNESPQDFAFKGYEIAAFPDKVDKALPLMGYLPGKLPWYFNKKLEALGVKIVNTLANGTCHRDRKLITGDSPLAANQFGRMATEALLEHAPVASI